MAVLVKAVQVAGQQPFPVGINCPASVELVTHVGAKGTVLFLLNQTTNQVTGQPARFILQGLIPYPNLSRTTSSDFRHLWSVGETTTNLGFLTEKRVTIVEDIDYGTKQFPRTP